MKQRRIIRNRQLLCQRRAGVDGADGVLVVGLSGDEDLADGEVLLFGLEFGEELDGCAQSDRLDDRRQRQDDAGGLRGQ